MFTTVNAKTVLVVDAEKGVNKSFENVFSLRCNQKFFKEGTPNFNSFSSVVFSGRINLKQVEEQKKKDPRGFEGMLPRKIFENSPTVMVILVHFKQIAGKLY